MATKSSKAKNPSDQTAFEASTTSLEVVEPPYSEDESKYRKWLLQRIETIRNIREAPQDELNGMSYLSRYVQNFKGGNSFSPPRRNPEDTSVVTGTTREKKLSIINSVVNLVFETVFRAFNGDNIEDQEIGEAFTDCVFQANKEEQWDEKKLYVYSELADQGDVFVEDEWVDETRLDKKKIKINDVTEETFKNFDAGKATKVVFSGPRRTVIPGPQVYLGNIRQPIIKLQPDLFTRAVIPYSQAEAIYGHLPRFKYVPRNLTPTDGQQDDHFGYNWRLEEIGDDMVEVLKYQNKPEDTLQLILNSVMQFPVGFPMPWEHGEYSLTQGHLEPISPFYAYSKSIPDKTALDQQVLDEMYRLAVLKNQKSFMPPIANFSASILTKDMFLPGKINNGLEKGEIEVLGGDPSAYAMTQSEMEMFKMVNDIISGKSVSAQYQGQNFGDRATATEVDQVLKQAKQNLGIMIVGFMNLHLNLDFLRLHILLENYTKERGEKVNELTGKLERKFASVTAEREIPGRGIGQKRVEFTENPNTPMELYDMEEGITRDKLSQKPLSKTPPKKPTHITQIKPSTLRSVKYRWYPEVVISERETPLAERIAYEDRLVKGAQLFGLENINWEYAQQQWAVKNKINPSYFFKQGQTPPMQEQVDAIQESPVTKMTRSNPTGVKEATRQGK